jgi:hypothetical protein
VPPYELTADTIIRAREWSLISATQENNANKGQFRQNNKNKLHYINPVTLLLSRYHSLFLSFSASPLGFFHSFLYQGKNLSHFASN